MLVLYQCSDNIKNYAEKYCNKNFVSYINSDNDEEIFEYVKKEKRCFIFTEISYAFEIKESFLKIVRSINQGCVVIGLFKSDKLYKLPEYINQNLLDMVEILPIDEMHFDKPLNSFDVNKKNNTKIISDIFKNEHDLQDMITMEYVYDLIYGSMDRIKAKTFEELSYFLGMNRIPQIVMTLLCDDFWNKCEHLDNKQRYKFKRNILNSVRKAMGKKYKGVAATLIGTDKIVILLDCCPHASKYAQDFAEEAANYIKDFVLEKTSYSVTIGISNYCSNHKELWKAYEESFRSLSSSFIQGANNIIKFEDYNVNYKSYTEYPKTMEQNIVRSISSSNFEQAYKDYDEICRYLIFNNFEQNVAKSIILEILFEIMEYSYSTGIDLNFLSNTMTEMVVKIIKSSVFKDVELIGKMFLEILEKEIENLYVDNNKKILSKAVLFMQKYYYTDLNLEEISRICNLSKYHFSRIFKKQFNMTVIQYLTNIRIEKACQLLKEGNNTISEIANKVGYQDIAYFSNIFKSNVGITPNQYKKINAKSNNLQK